MELPRENGYYVYILYCNDYTLYTGWTTNLIRRLYIHNMGKASKYTRVRRPVEMLYYEKCSGKVQAMQREYSIKQMSRKEKEMLLRLKIYYEDTDIIVVEKPVGVESQVSKGLSLDMVSMIRNHLSTTNSGEYIGVIHRLDKPVGGIMVFAKNKNAAKWLSQEMIRHKIQKKYEAIVCGKLVDKCGELQHFLWKDTVENISKVVDNCGQVSKGKQATLKYKVLEEIEREGEDFTRVEIIPMTGRHHQIRVQFSYIGHSIYGDQKYGNIKYKHKRLALKSIYLGFIHPTTRKWMEFYEQGIDW